MRQLFTGFVVVSLVTLTAGDGAYWWMNGGAFGGGATNNIPGNHNKGNLQNGNNNPGNNFQRAANNQQNFQQGNVLPATQGLVSNQNQGGSCPAVTNIPPVDQCAGRASNCWSVGQADVDCIDNALCCFDGCANVCQGAGVRPGLPTPQQNARGQSTPNSNQNNNLPVPQNNNLPLPQNNNQRPVNNQGGQSTNNIPAKNGNNGNNGYGSPSQSFPTNNGCGGGGSGSGGCGGNAPANTGCSGAGGCGGSAGHPAGTGCGGSTGGGCGGGGYSEGEGTGLLFPPPAAAAAADSNGYNQGSISPAQPPNPRPQPQQPVQQQSRPVQQQPRPVQQQPRPVQQQPQQPRQPVQQQQPRPVQQQQQQPVQQQQNFVPASQKPYTQCPSAMKCVVRESCDFNGVMSNEVFNLTPELEMLRVPLIPCVNLMRGNAVDVCCRDPNYQDPWPDMNNGNNNNGNNNNGNQGANTGFQDPNSNNNFQGTNNNNNNQGVAPAKKKKPGYGRRR